MSKSYRLRTSINSAPTADQTIRVNIDQDFDFLEILSLKLTQSDVYRRFCADYGVLVGRVVANGGFGIPNARVSVFVPIDNTDQINPVISTLYPYTSPTDINEDGYRYNLLPYEPSYEGHVATGTFPTKEDILSRTEVLEIYEKYYKYTVKTNESGDYMIVGVPTGDQQIVVDVDLSDMGCFSLRPSDLIRMNRANRQQFDGNNFKSSEDLSSLPQIVNLVKTVNIGSFWGESESCNVGITRVDFDLRDQNINIEPTSLFMGSIFSSNDEDYLKTNCKPKAEQGDLCGLVTGPGTILAIRQTIDLDRFGRPVLEQYVLPSGGKVIDENGAFLVDVPMNMDYLTTDEYGNLVVSLDPKVGIPSKGKYRFKIKYNSPEKDIASMPNPTQFIRADILNLQAFAPKGTVLRANYLLPNIKEYGWTFQGNNQIDPANFSTAVTTKYTFNSNDIEETIVISSGPNQSHRIKKLSEVSSVKIEINDVVDNSKWIDVPITQYPAGASIKITVIKKTEIRNVNGVDVEVPMAVDLELNTFDYNYSLFQRSYSFSLDWDDYPNYEDAINCEDTFYEFYYNKVYTTAQLIDEYRYGTTRGRFLAIKEILERSCQSEVNKFPINDGVRNFDLLYFILSVFFFLFSIILPVVILVYDLVQILWKYVVKYILYFIIQIFVVILSIFRAIVRFFSKSSADKLGNFIRGLQNFANNILDYELPPIRLPLITYPDCSACDCKSSDEVVGEGGKYSESNVSILGDVNIPATYQRTPDIPQTMSEYDQHNEEIFNEVYGQLAAGRDDSDGKPIGRTPSYTNEDNTTRAWLTSQIPIPERINLFNGKGKYFTSTAAGGFNRIKIFPNYEKNEISPKNYQFYEDQPYVILADPSAITTLSAGTMLSFVSNDISGDKNYKSAIKVTGTTPTTKSISTQVVYANPNNYNENITKTFNLVNNYTGKTEYVFPVDMEYSQVITAITIGDLEKIIGTSSVNDYGFYRRVIKGQIEVNVGYNDIDGNSQFKTLQDKKIAIETIPNYKNLVVLMLMKGVDPYSTRQKTKIDISLPFGLSEGTVIVESNYKFNQPILKGLELLKYNQTSFNNFANPFYPSKFFTPSTNTDRGFSSFTSNTITLYSSYGPGFSSTDDGGGVSSEKIGTTFSGYYVATSTPGTAKWPTNVLVTSNNPDGYYTYEYVEGVSLMARYPGTRITDKIKGGFFKLESRVYDTGYTYNMVNNQNIIMRSDRLPRSDSFDDQYVFAQNKSFAIYTINETGNFAATQSISANLDFSNSSGDDFQDAYGSGTTQLIGSFSCDNIVPLGAYQSQSDGQPLTVKPKSDPQNNEVYYVDGNTNYPKIENGCYVVSDKMFAIVEDMKQIAEWKSRFMLNLAICRNVFGMIFTNQWINGGLYLPGFQNDKIYRGGLNVSDPEYNYCKKKLVFRIENNSFFYRSSPYNNGFIGMKANKLRSQKGNNYFLGNPVTVMDLGPKDNIIKNICPSPRYDGYYINKLSPTTFNQPDDLFQLFIISRLTNSKFWGQLFSLGNAGISQFFSRNEKKIDGDFAQLVSINSELGVVPFSPETYKDSNLFFGKTENPLVGVFFSSDTATRDFVSPGRTTYIDTAKKFAYNTFGQKSQTVPMYKWQRDTKATINGVGILFGSELNDWYTNPTVNVGSGNFFYSSDYQSIDRLNDSTYYPSPILLPSTQRPGYIYSSKIIYDSNKNPTGYTFDGFISASTIDNSQFLVGAPNHFYFGLKVGKTALDKFITEYAIEV